MRRFGTTTHRARSGGTRGARPVRREQRAGASDQRKKGGTLKLISAGDVDSVDPGQTYYSFGWQILTAVHRTLYATPANSTKTFPDLAAGPPKISADGKTITVKIKRGVRYSPPVNREVTSADVKYAIERSFSVSVTNGYVSLYFSNIVGLRQAAEDPEAGLRDPDAGQVHDRLQAQRAGDDRRERARHDEHRSNPEGVRREVRREDDLRLRLLPGGHRAVHVRGRQLGEHQGQGLHARPSDEARPQPELVREDGLPARVRRLDRGQAGLHRHDGRRPPDPQRNRGRRRRLRDTSRADPEADHDESEVQGQLLHLAERHRYISLNTTKKPFDNVNVRRAANFVMDKNALRLIGGGPITGPIATHVLGPEFKGKGFEAAGGFGYDPYRQQEPLRGR